MKINYKIAVYLSIWLYLMISTVWYRFHHIEMTETELFMHFKDALLFKE